MTDDKRKRRLTDDEVTAICMQINSGKKLTEIAKQFDVSNITISLISSKKTHAKITTALLGDRTDNRAGSKNHLSKLTDQSVQDIRKIANQYATDKFGKLDYYKVAEHFGISYNTVRDVISGKTWNHV
jgi:transposase